MSFLYLVDDVPVPAADCDWMLVAPCGCVQGLCKMLLGDGVLVLDEATAMRHWEPSGKERNRMKRAGFTAKVARRRDAIKLFSGKCPHQDGVS